uniref:Uncharacterized protein n=1 Tax=Anopheles atroparvus TaxID=41427 RepID=A0AAG5DFI5_ANOAO
MDVALAVVGELHQQQVRVLGERVRDALGVAQLDQEVVEHHEQTVERLDALLALVADRRDDVGEHRRPLDDQVRHVHHVLQHRLLAVHRGVRRHELDVHHHQLGDVLHLTGGPQLHDHIRAHVRKVRYHRQVPQQPVAIVRLDRYRRSRVVLLLEHLQQQLQPAYRRLARGAREGRQAAQEVLQYLPDHRLMFARLVLQDALQVQQQFRLPARLHDDGARVGEQKLAQTLHRQVVKVALRVLHQIGQPRHRLGRSLALDDLEQQVRLAAPAQQMSQPVAHVQLLDLIQHRVRGPPCHTPRIHQDQLRQQQAVLLGDRIRREVVLKLEDLRLLEGGDRELLVGRLRRSDLVGDAHLHQQAQHRVLLPAKRPERGRIVGRNEQQDDPCFPVQRRDGQIRRLVVRRQHDIVRMVVLGHLEQQLDDLQVRDLERRVVDVPQRSRPPHQLLRDLHRVLDGERDLLLDADQQDAQHQVLLQWNLRHHAQQRRSLRLRWPLVALGVRLGRIEQQQLVQGRLVVRRADRLVDARHHVLHPRECLILHHRLLLVERTERGRALRLAPAPDGHVSFADLRRHGQEHAQAHEIDDRVEDAIAKLRPGDLRRQFGPGVLQQCLAEHGQIDVVAEHFDELAEKEPQRSQDVLALQQELLVDLGQVGRRFGRLRLEHHRQHAHVVRVACVRQFVLHDVFQQRGQDVRLAVDHFLQPDHEDVYQRFRFQAHLGQIRKHLVLFRILSGHVVAQVRQQFLNRFHQLTIVYPHLQPRHDERAHLQDAARERQEAEEVFRRTLRSLAPVKLILDRVHHHALELLAHMPEPGRVRIRILPQRIAKQPTVR